MILDLAGEITALVNELLAGDRRDRPRNRLDGSTRVSRSLTQSLRPRFRSEPRLVSAIDLHHRYLRYC